VWAPPGVGVAKCGCRRVWALPGDGNQVEDAQAHEAQAQQRAQAQRITRSMARALGQEYQKMALLISFVEKGCGCNK